MDAGAKLGGPMGWVKQPAGVQVCSAGWVTVEHVPKLAEHTVLAVSTGVLVTGQP